MKYYQGDIIKIGGFRTLFLIVSKNAYINSTGVFHVCPLVEHIEVGPLHLAVHGDSCIGTVICEQVRMIDPAVRNCMKVDRIRYAEIMNVSDTLQGIFEYD